MSPLPFTVLSLALAPLLASATAQIPIELYSPLIPQKLLATAQKFTSPGTTYPQWTTITPSDGKWQFFKTDTWTSGFFPASLMLMYERGQKCGGSSLISQQDASTSLDEGRLWSVPLTGLETNNTVKHDVGFISFPFWEEIRINPANTTAATHIKAFAAYLAGRFNPTVGCTKSWDIGTPPEFPVIIDNMINIELFFIAADLLGPSDPNYSLYRFMATSHADHTMVNHIRPDGSTYHVVTYDANTGAVLHQGTAQGYSDSSTWSRGQAWGMYGFTSMYNRTGNATYLDTARRLSTWYINHLPEDNSVPFWDFNAPSSPTPPRDTSSAAIASSAMLFLSQMETRAGNQTGSDLWRDHAISLLRDTVALGFRGQNEGWESILSNGTANNPNLNNNTGLTYGDYYFIKAGNMLLDMGLANCSSGSGAITNP
ncbi:hypothetical protein FRB90_006125, partial [Tulasnella sp. 427]